MPHLAHIAIVVRDYDEALAFYVGKLGFELVEDTYQPEQDKRWITIRPPNAPPHATTILLARASTDHQARYIGDQAGGRVFLFLATDDFARNHATLTAAGVEWVRPPVDYDYGRVAVWKDLYGNLWDLVQFAPGRPAGAPAGDPRALRASGDPPDDGYGQSLIDDLRSAWRFRKLRRQPIDWQPAAAWPGDVLADFPILDRFGDLVCWRRADGEDWFVVERMWHGWPDPPEFAFLAFAAGRIVTGRDFAQWPGAWQRPAETSGATIPPRRGPEVDEGAGRAQTGPPDTTFAEAGPAAASDLHATSGRDRPADADDRQGTQR